MEISPFIKNKTQEIIDYYFDRDSISASEVIKEFNAVYCLIDFDEDKLHIVQGLIEASNETYNKHRQKCESKTCDVSKNHAELDFLMKKELRLLDVPVPTDSFSVNEKNIANKIVDRVVDDLSIQLKGQEETLKQIIAELHELKQLHIIGKKNWKQQFAGKITDMVSSGVISELTAKPIIEKVLKPSAEFIANQFLI